MFAPGSFPLVGNIFLHGTVQSSVVPAASLAHLVRRPSCITFRARKGNDRSTYLTSSLAVQTADQVSGSNANRVGWATAVLTAISARRRRGMMWFRKNLILRFRNRFGRGILKWAIQTLAKIETMATAEGLKEFTGKQHYEFGDVTKKAVSKLTGKNEYQFGDLSKAAASKITGKEDYEFGDISKAVVTGLTGKCASEYKFGDITKAGISTITGKDEYVFGDIAKTVVTKVTGRDAGEYQFGDVTKSIVSGMTGKEEYAFGDITRAAMSKVNELGGAFSEAEQKLEKN